MRSLIISALFAVTLAFSMEAEARVETPCTAFGRPCDCPWYMRDCLPTCHIAPQIKCEPTL